MTSIFDKLKIAREIIGLSQTEAAQLCGLDQRDISLLEKGKKKFIPIQYIQFLHSRGIDTNTLYNEGDEVIHRKKLPSTPTANQYFPLKSYQSEQIPPIVSEPLASPNASPSASPTPKKAKKSLDFMPKVITVDNAGNENILYVPVAARAGYLLGHGDPKYLSTLPSFSIPGMRNGTFRMFDVQGPSMAPTIGDGDKVIAQFVERLDDIIDGRVYVVVTTDGIAIKRVLNRVSQRNKLVMKSDTIAHRVEFRTYEIDPSSVVEIWYCKMKLSADFSEPSEIYTRINDLEADVVELRGLAADVEELKRLTASKL